MASRVPAAASILADVTTDVPWEPGQPALRMAVPNAQSAQHSKGLVMVARPSITCTSTYYANSMPGAVFKYAAELYLQELAKGLSDADCMRWTP